MKDRSSSFRSSAARVGRRLGVVRGAARALALNALGRTRDDLVNAHRIGRSARASSRPSWGEASQRVLFFSNRHWPSHLAVEATVAHALEQRGAATRFLTCAGAMPLCDSHHLEELARRERLCDNCVGGLKLYLRALGQPPLGLDDYVSEAELPLAGIAALRSVEEVAAFELADLPLGQLVLATLRRIFLVEVAGGDEQLEVARLLLRGAAAVAIGAPRVFDALRPSRLVACNGAFHAEQVMLACAERAGIPAVTWEFGPVPGRVVFEHGRVAFDPPREAALRELRPLREGEQRELERCLAAFPRYRQLWPTAEEDWARIAGELDLDPTRPFTVLYPNVVWDATFFGKQGFTGGMFDWLELVVRWFVSHPERTLVIRSHPAEVRLHMQRAKERVDTWFASAFPNPPANVRVVPPESPLSSYVLGSRAERALVHTSTLGLELATCGLEVIVGGDAHYRGLGFTRDPGSVAELLECLEAEPRPLEPDARERARRYAHLFFLRYNLPLRQLSLRGSDVGFEYHDVRELARPDPVLDCLCEGVLAGGEFLLP